MPRPRHHPNGRQAAEKLVRTAPLVSRWIERVLAAHDPPLTVAQYLALQAVADGEVVGAELARRAAVSPAGTLPERRRKERRKAVGNKVGPRRGAQLAIDEGGARRAARLAAEEGRDLETARRRERRHKGRAAEEARLAHEGRVGGGRPKP